MLCETEFGWLDSGVVAKWTLSLSRWIEMDGIGI